LRTFRKAGVPVSPLPFPDANKRLNEIKQRWNVFLELAEETTKVAYYKIRAWG
jgi:hypothetical protein